MKPSFVYVVTMYRWGDRENHSYVHGVFSKKKKALDEAQAEKEYRGGNKYYPEVLEMDLNDPQYKKTVLELEANPDFTKKKGKYV